MTLLILMVKVSAVLALALAAAALARRRSAAVRHWILATGILCALALPAITLAVPAWHPDRPAGERASRVHVSETIVLPTSAGGAPEVGRVAGADVRMALVRLWAAGAAVGLCSLLAGLWRLSQIARQARPVGGEWLAQAGELSKALALRTPVRFRETACPALLVTFGARRADVLLPPGASAWDVDRIRIAAAHELAHVQRGDWPLQLLGELLRVVYWFHPLAWLACRKLRQESECACDDTVLSLGISRTHYAAELVALARGFSAAAHRRLPALAIARPSMLHRRIRAMLNVQLDRRPLSTTGRLFAGLLMLLATLPIAAIATQPNATVSGTVSDTSGRPLAGATVTLSNPARELVVETKSNASGAYSVPVVPGDYTLDARQPGFAVLSQRLSLAGGESVQRPLVLQIGSLRETVNVARGPKDARASVSEVRRARVGRRECTASGSNGQITPPIKVANVNPDYPAGAAAAPTPTVVRLEARIGVDGTVEEARVITQAAPEFEASAIAAVRQWEFTPALLNCEPVPVTMFVTVNYETRRP